jgi:hypothetical protein
MPSALSCIGFERALKNSQGVFALLRTARRVLKPNTFLVGVGINHVLKFTELTAPVRVELYSNCQTVVSLKFEVLRKYVMAARKFA